MTSFPSTVGGSVKCWAVVMRMPGIAVPPWEQEPNPGASYSVALDIAGNCMCNGSALLQE
jgi:hypothetical protein